MIRTILAALITTTLCLSGSAEVRWIGSSGDWHIPANWDSGAVPKQNDDAVIDVAGTPTITISQGNQVVHGLRSLDNLTVTGGNLTIMGGSGQIDGSFTLGSNRSFSANGSSVVVAGNAVVDEGHLAATNGGSLKFTNLPSYRGAASFASGLGASGGGSILDASTVTTFNGGTNYDTNVWADRGGRVDLSGLTQITVGSVDFFADGPQSVIDVSKLTNYTATNAFEPRIRVANGGTVLAGSLSKLLAVVSASGGSTLNFPALTSANGSYFSVVDGGQINLPALTSYTGQSSAASTLEAHGAGTVLNLSAITTFNGGTNYDTNVWADRGGRVDLSGLTQITVGSVDFFADGPQSVIDVSKLTNYTATNAFEPRIRVANGGTVVAGSLSKLLAVVSASGGSTLNFPALTSANGSYFSVVDGGQINLPALTSYTGQSSAASTLEAHGTGTVLNLSAITTFNGGTNYDTNVWADRGGRVDLSGVTQITVGSVDFFADGPQSVIDVSKLTNYTATNAFEPRIRVANGGTVVAGSLSKLLAVVSASGGSTLNFPALTSANGSYFSVVDGGQINLPALTSYTGQSSAASTLEAHGAGTVLNLSAITTFNGGTNYDTNVWADRGGRVDLSGLTQITVGSVDFFADGPQSVIDVSKLTNYAATNAFEARIRAVNGGKIVLSNQPVTLSRVSVGVIGLGSSITSGDLTFLKDAVLFGDGTVSSDVRLADGAIAPGIGSPPSGSLTIAGDLNVETGTLFVDASGLSPGTEHDVLNVNGTARLGGIIQVQAVNNFRPKVGDQITFLKANSVVGHFDRVEGIPIPSTRLGWAVGYTATQAIARATLIGDVNLDNEFGSTDLVRIFQAGEYEDSLQDNSTWIDGDWNGDGDFDSGDLVVAFQAGAYETGPVTAHSVPEPLGVHLVAAAGLWITLCFRRITPNR